MADARRPARTHGWYSGWAVTMCKQCDQLAERVKALEAEIVDIKRVCPCWLSRLREREPTRMEVELRRLDRKKRAGEK